MKWIRKALMGISLTSAMFVFQACYGTMEDYDPGNKITFRVLDSQTEEPLKDIEVQHQYLYDDSSASSPIRLLDFTDENGSINTWQENGLMRFHFIDRNHIYNDADTVFRVTTADTIDILMTRAN